MTLRNVAHARAGDKGNISNIAVFAYDPSDFDLLCRYLTAERVREHFAETVEGEIVRYELPKLAGLNFVMHGALGGGVTRSLALDPHGKCLSSVLLDMKIPGEDWKCRKPVTSSGTGV